jgi:hypothetical protein
LRREREYQRLRGRLIHSDHALSGRRERSAA